jgi:c-di-GMP-binding flagellar brake protein YcgR
MAQDRIKQVQAIEQTPQTMRFLTTKNHKRIRQTIDFLSVNRKPISLQAQGEQTLFGSMIVKAEHAGPVSKPGLSGRLIIDWLSPANGNQLIQSANPIQVRFSVGMSQCEFTSYYLRRSVESPYFGHIISYPQSMAVADRRRQVRHERDGDSAPLFVSARLKTKASRMRPKSYDLDIFDVCERGIGMLVGKNLHDFLERIRIGDRLTELELYAPWSLVRVVGTVKHKSKINEGKYRDCYILGVELDENLEQYV